MSYNPFSEQLCDTAVNVYMSFEGSLSSLSDKYTDMTARLRAEQKSLERLEADYTAERQALEALKVGGDKSAKKRAYFDDEMRKALDSYMRQRTAIEEKYVASVDVKEGKAEAIRDAKALVDEKLEAQVTKIRDRAETEIALLEEKIKAIRARAEGDEDILRKKAAAKEKSLGSKEKEELLKIEAKEKRKGSELQEAKDKYESYLTYLKSQTEALNVDPLSKKMALLQERIAQQVTKVAQTQDEIKILDTQVAKMVMKREKDTLEANRKERQRLAIQREEERLQAERDRKEAAQREAELLAEAEAAKRRWAAMTPKERVEHAKKFGAELSEGFLASLKVEANEIVESGLGEV